MMCRELKSKIDAKKKDNAGVVRLLTDRVQILRSEYWEQWKTSTNNLVFLDEVRLGGTEPMRSKCDRPRFKTLLSGKSHSCRTVKAWQKSVEINDLNGSMNGKAFKVLLNIFWIVTYGIAVVVMDNPQPISWRWLNIDSNRLVPVSWIYHLILLTLIR